jgi:hypothetical protein
MVPLSKSKVAPRNTHSSRGNKVCQSSWAAKVWEVLPSTRRPRATRRGVPDTLITSSKARTAWPSESPERMPASPTAPKKSFGSAVLELGLGFAPVILNHPMIVISVTPLKA